MNMSKYTIVSIIVFFISGCASTQVKHDPEFLSGSYRDQVQHEVQILPVIDARDKKEKDLQDIIGYSTLYDASVKSKLERKGFLVKELDINIRSCPSVTNINNVQELTCLSSIDASQLNMILLLSVDEYTAPKTMSASGLAYVSGVLYDVKSNSVLWRDSISKGSNSEAMLLAIGGGGGYLGGLLVKALSPNIIYRNDAFTSMNAILDTIPEYPAQK